MIEYSFNQIKLIDENGITFKDGTRLIFEECRHNWALYKGLSVDDTKCVAERDITAPKPYFLFYSNDRIKVIFNNTFFLRKYRNKKQFLDLQIRLNRLGYSSYDIS